MQHRMNIAFRLALMLVAAVVGLAAGYVLRSKRVPQATASASSNPDGTAPAVSPIQLQLDAHRHPAAGRNDDSPLATQLEHDLSMSSGVTRWLYWLDALERAVPSDFPRLHRLARGDAAAKRLVEARWIEVAPRHLFNLIAAGP